MKEGIVYKNYIGTYLHGPVLPKNPHLADHLILQALRNKYGDVEGTSMEMLNHLSLWMMKLKTRLMRSLLNYMENNYYKIYFIEKF